MLQVDYKYMIDFLNNHIQIEDIQNDMLDMYGTDNTRDLAPSQVKKIAELYNY